MVHALHLLAKPVLLPQSVGFEVVVEHVVQIVPLVLAERKARKALVAPEGNGLEKPGRNVCDDGAAGEIQVSTVDRVHIRAAVAKKRKQFARRSNMEEFAFAHDIHIERRKAFKEHLRKLLVDVTRHGKQFHLFGSGPVDEHYARIDEMTPLLYLGFLQKADDRFASAGLAVLRRDVHAMALRLEWSIGIGHARDSRTRKVGRRIVERQQHVAGADK